MTRNIERAWPTKRRKQLRRRRNRAHRMSTASRIQREMAERRSAA